MSDKSDESFEEFVDFVKYAFHESMLPHHFMPKDIEWRQNRVAVEAQKILNKYNIDQSAPVGYVLLHNEEFWDSKKQKPYSKIQRFLLKWFFKEIIK